MPGVTRALCERCMPRLEGDFLFCWTAMTGSWNHRAATQKHGQQVGRLNDARGQLLLLSGATGKLGNLEGLQCRGPVGAKPAIIAQVYCFPVFSRDRAAKGC